MKKQITLKNGKKYIITRCYDDCPIYNNEYMGCNFDYDLFPSKEDPIPKECKLKDYIENEQLFYIVCGASPTFCCQYRLSDNACSKRPADCVYGICKYF